VDSARENDLGKKLWPLKVLIPATAEQLGDLPSAHETTAMARWYSATFSRPVLARAIRVNIKKPNASSGVNAKFAAAPAEGYRFKKWTVNGTAVTEGVTAEIFTDAYDTDWPGSVLNLTNIQTDTAVTVEWELIPPEIDSGHEYNVTYGEGGEFLVTASGLEVTYSLTGAPFLFKQ